MPIKVTLPKQVILDYAQQVLDEYNKRKKPNDPLLEFLSSKEVGFKIRVDNRKTERVSGYVENTFKQMRWNRTTLVSFYNYPAFSVEEEKLLFQSMRQIFGKDNVIYYSTYGHALANSPNTNIEILHQLTNINGLYSELASKSPIKSLYNSYDSMNNSSHSHFLRPKIII